MTLHKLLRKKSRKKRGDPKFKFYLSLKKFKGFNSTANTGTTGTYNMDKHEIGVCLGNIYKFMQLKLRAISVKISQSGSLKVDKSVEKEPAFIETLMYYICDTITHEYIHSAINKCLPRKEYNNVYLPLTYQEISVRKLLNHHNDLELVSYISKDMNIKYEHIYWLKNLNLALREFAYLEVIGVLTVITIVLVTVGFLTSNNVKLLRFLFPTITLYIIFKFTIFKIERNVSKHKIK